MALHKTAIIIILIALAMAERVFFDLGPNVELVTLMSVLAAVWFGARFGLITAVVSLIISDLVIGNTNIFLFTWSGFAVIGWTGWYLTKFSGLKRILAGGAFGLLASLWFYGYTNFGVWLIGGLYPPTLAGLAQSYYMGLPFLKLQAVSNALLLTVAMIVLELKVNFNKQSLKVMGSRWNSGAMP